MMKKHKRTALLLLVFAMLTTIVVSSTFAFLSTEANTVVNTFSPAKMSCVVNETFDGSTKENVCVQNTSDAPAYIRVKLLPYWRNNENTAIVAKDAWTIKEDAFPSDSKWILGADGYYYYTEPVPIGGETEAIIDSLTLDQDGVTLSRQVLEIIASCVQADPKDAVLYAWGASSGGSVTAVNGDTLTIAESIN